MNLELRENLDEQTKDRMSSSVGWSVAGSSLRVHLQQLRWCGIYRLSSREPSSWRQALYDMYRKLSVTIITGYIAQMCIYAYRERNDMEKLVRVMFLILCYITSLVKQIVFFVDADSIDRMIASMDDPLNNQSGAQHRVLLVAAAREAGRFARVFSLAAFGVATLWLIIPIMYYAGGQPVEFQIWIYIEYSGPVGFTFIASYTYYVTTLIGIGNTSMDAFIATVLKQCKVQLTILRINFENLPNYAKMLSKDSATNETFEKVLDRVFLDCLTHYRKISEMMHLLQDIFGSAILVQFGISGWIICLVAYKMVMLNFLSVEFASLTLFISCILTELFLYCYYGNEVTLESDRVMKSLYAMEWRHTPVRFQRSLVIAMERAKRPLRPVAGRVIPLSLDTFVKIIKSSYTFYAVLRQTK